MTFIYFTNQVEIHNKYYKITKHGSEHQIVTRSIELWDDAVSHTLLSLTMVSFALLKPIQ